MDVSGNRGEAFACNVVHNIEHAEAPATGQLVVNEIQRPAGICFCFDEDRRTGANSTPPRLALAHRKTFLPIQSVDAIDAGRLSITPKKDEQPSVSETPALIGEIAQPQSQFDFRRSAGSVANHFAVGGYDLAGPPFRKPHLGFQKRDGFTLGGGPYH